MAGSRLGNSHLAPKVSDSPGLGLTFSVFFSSHDARYLWVPLIVEYRLDNEDLVFTLFGCLGLARYVPDCSRLALALPTVKILHLSGE